MELLLLLQPKQGNNACSAVHTDTMTVRQVGLYKFQIHGDLQYNLKTLGSVAGPVIQANGRLTFEDDLRSGGLLCFTTQ
jgi:hypothetical protein